MYSFYVPFRKKQNPNSFVTNVQYLCALFIACVFNAHSFCRMDKNCIFEKKPISNVKIRPTTFLLKKTLKSLSFLNYPKIRQRSHDNSLDNSPSLPLSLSLSGTSLLKRILQNPNRKTFRNSALRVRSLSF